MKTLLKNGTVVNVFTDELERANVLISDGCIIGVGDYSDSDADYVTDVAGGIICPGFIDGHIHIESSMLTPTEFARVCLPHGTTTVVADPHEIANVAGTAGIRYMLEASEGLPLDVYIMLPSCVPATPLDENGASLGAEELLPFYDHERVLGLGEVMNYPGVLANDAAVIAKIEDARRLGMTLNGHAPALSGRELDRYISAGIRDDHECFTEAEALERIRKGQWVMVREGTAARNLNGLLTMFDEPYSRRCMLVTDDRHPADLIRDGEIDNIIRLAVRAGKSAAAGIRMATLQAAEYYGLSDVGAVAPGYQADLLVLDDLDSVKIRDVYKNGIRVVTDGVPLEMAAPAVTSKVNAAVRNSFRVGSLESRDFHVEPKGRTCRVIRLVPHQLITGEWVTELDFDRANGVDTERDILKIAVIERHRNTGHRGIGYISGFGLKKGAIASSVSHDSHNIIVVGTNDGDMAAAANRVCELGGGNVVVSGGEILAEMPLPIGGLMSLLTAEEAASANEAVRNAAHSLGGNEGVEPFMNMSFISLPVIPYLKITTTGLVDVETQSPVELFTDIADA